MNQTTRAMGLVNPQRPPTPRRRVRPGVPPAIAATSALCLLASAAAAADRSSKWSRDDAAHLLRRAGFSGAPAEIDHLHRMGRDAAVRSLLEFGDRPENLTPPTIVTLDLPDRAERRAMSDDERQQLAMDRRRADHAQLLRMRRWWIERLATTRRPLQEKMVLFWHGLLTSGHREVQSSRALWEQNQLFRLHGLGNYRTLLLEISKDPAMVLYLNNAQNVARNPNENYARELLELFTLGPGHYSETDIKEIARAFTGWNIDRDSGEFVFRPRQHDYGRKHILGVRGDLNGGDVIDIILKKPQAAEALVSRLWRYFASTEPPREVVRSLAAVFRTNRYELKPLLAAMFSHDAFYRDDVRFSHVKSPVELLVGLQRELGITPVDLDAMAMGMRLMGQDLFQPPNVKGWDGDLAWINTATLFNRYNVTGRLISGTEGGAGRARAMRAERDDLAMMSDPPPSDGQPPFDPLPMLTQLALATPDAVIDHLILRLFQRPIAPERRERLVRHLRERAGEPVDMRSPRNTDAVREAIMLMTAMPEYQLS